MKFRSVVRISPSSQLSCPTLFSSLLCYLKGKNYSSALDCYGKTFDKILIANRGEIACRVIKTAKKMGIKTVAIYSEADSHSLHTELADEAYCVGPAPTNKSYLNIDAILDAVKKSGAQAVHPGYGFLSENFKFCQALDEHGVTFIGPSVQAMAKMGDKIESKIIAKDAKVHTIPGFNGIVENVDHAISLAKEIGYPIMIKASAGGGGKGMRIAWNDEDVRRNFKIAATESKASFGDDRLLVEKYIEEPRHIEIQILGDRHGNVIYLPERECSIQRRNQKVIEEAPSMAINADIRSQMGNQAVQLAKKVGYSSAGTVEFLLDKHKRFYFLEMNTRLQVEHPITEYITNIDLVEQMIRVAANQKLAIKQSDIRINGWAFESRIYAEDSKLFLPSIGRLEQYVEPLEVNNPNIRCDSGIKEGSEISIYYDPLICKLCTHGNTRDEALNQMQKALDRYVIRGVTHNIPIIRKVLSQERFQKGQITTNYLSEEFPEGFTGHQLSLEEQRQIAMAAVFVYDRQQQKSNFLKINNKTSLFISIKGQQQQQKENEDYEIISIDSDRTDKCIKISDQQYEFDATWKASSSIINMSVNGSPLIIQYHGSPHHGSLRLQLHGTVYTVTVQTALEKELSKYLPKRSMASSERIIKAPMAGQIVSTSIKEGDIVREGAELLIIEAMKMQNVLRAPKPAKIIKIHASPSQNVSAEQVLVELEYL